MNGKTPTVQAVFEVLEQEGLVEPGWRSHAAVQLAREADVQPWYVRTMVGFGAWIASLLLILFIGSMSALLFLGMGIKLDSLKQFAIAGFLLIAGAVLLRRVSSQDFMVQAALAASLAGQALFTLGVSDNRFETGLVTLIVIQAVLIVVFPDRVHRFLSVIFGVAAAVVLLFHWKMQMKLHVLVLGLTVIFLWLEANEERFIERGRTEFTQPLAYGALIAMFGCVMLSTVYILPELIRLGGFSFYPAPWVSSLGFGALLIYMQLHYWRQDQLPLSGPLLVQLQVASALIVAASLPAPGIAASLLVLLVGSAQSNRLLTGVGFAFLSVFLAGYFYGIEQSMLDKSLTLTATGLLVLAAAFYFRFRLARLKEDRDAQ